MTILAITLNPHRVSFQTAQSKSTGSSGGTYYSQAVDTAGKVAEHGVSLFAPAAEIISGAVALFLGLVSEYVLKDSVLDKMSKVISFLGLGSIAVGGWGLFKYIKKQTTPPATPPTGIQPPNAELVKVAEGAISHSDRNFTRGYDGANTGAIFSGDQSNGSLDASAKELLELYLSPDVVNIVNSHTTGPEPLITGISDSPISIKNLEERVAALLAFAKPTVAHVALSTDDSSSPPLLARDLVFTTNDVNEMYHRMLPDDFINAYRLGRVFEENYLANDKFDNISKQFPSEDSLKALITNFTEAEAKTINENLNTLQFSLDNLEALKKIITVVISQSNVADPKVQRNLSVVKQGLMCAFNLEGVDGKEVNGKLLEILKLSENGVESRLKTIKDKFESLKTILNDAKFPLQKKESGAISLNENVRDIKQNEFVLRATSA